MKRFQRPAIFLLGLFFLAGAVLFFPSVKGDIPVLMYHFAGSEEVVAQNKNTLTTQSFRMQMSYLKFFGCRVLSIDEYHDLLTGKKQPNGERRVGQTCVQPRTFFLCDPIRIEPRFRERSWRYSISGQNGCFS